jgi:hypothetical protein
VDALFGTQIADLEPAETEAYILASDVDAAGAILVTAMSDASIEAEIANSSTSMAILAANPVTEVAIGAVIALNKLSTEVQASIDGAAQIDAVGDIDILAQDSSSIDATVEVASLALAIAKQSTSVSVGLSIARNEIRNDLQAFIRDSGAVTATNGSVHVNADETANIDATSTASAIAVAVGVKESTAVSGGGAALADPADQRHRGQRGHHRRGNGAGRVGSSRQRLWHHAGAAARCRVRSASGSTPAVAIGFSLAATSLAGRTAARIRPGQGLRRRHRRD